MNMIDNLKQSLPDWAVGYVDGALSGDVDEVVKLISASPNNMRGVVVRSILKNLGASGDAIRTALSMGWDHDHREMLQAFGERGLVKAMKRASFELPDSICGKTIQIWRGVSDVERPGCGVSWTIDRDVACWFAMRNASDPAVMTRKVKRSSVVFFSNDRHESEVIVSSKGAGLVDGDVDDWAAGAERFTNRIATHNLNA